MRAACSIEVLQQIHFLLLELVQLCPCSLFALLCFCKLVLHCVHLLLHLVGSGLSSPLGILRLGNLVLLLLLSNCQLLLQLLLLRLLDFLFRGLRRTEASCALAILSFSCSSATVSFCSSCFCFASSIFSSEVFAVRRLLAPWQSCPSPAPQQLSASAPAAFASPPRFSLQRSSPY